MSACCASLEKEEEEYIGKSLWMILPKRIRESKESERMLVVFRLSSSRFLKKKTNKAGEKEPNDSQKRKKERKKEEGKSTVKRAVF